MKVLVGLVLFEFVCIVICVVSSVINYFIWRDMFDVKHAVKNGVEMSGLMMFVFNIGLGLIVLVVKYIEWIK